MLKIEVFSSPVCSKCSHAKDVLKNLVDELGGEKIQLHEVNILDEMDYSY